MIRPVWLRTLTALWGIWFATALTEPAGLLACPMHSGQAAMASAAVADDNSAPAADVVVAGDEHAAHGSASASPRHDAGSSQALGSGSTHAPDPSGHHSCTCLGQCCTMAIDALAARADVLLPAQASRVIRAPLPAVVASIATPVEHSRPFANGPPAIVG